MNPQEAKALLQLCRPDTDDARDPEVAEALEWARRDPELKGWLEQQQTFHVAIRQTLQRIDPPPGLRESILSGLTLASRRRWWRRAELLALAAGLVLLACLARIWLFPGGPNTLEAYRTRMAKEVARGYRMDLLTNDLAQIRSFLAQAGTPRNYHLSRGLEQTPVLGCAVRRWLDRPVSLICFRRSGGALLWLFVINRADLRDPPPLDSPQLQPLGRLITATWTHEEQTYLLATLGSPSVLQPYF